MQVERKKNNMLYVTNTTPSCKDVKAKLKQLYREVVELKKRKESNNGH